MADPAKHLRISKLLDVYGELLTERQLEFTRAHYEEDLTFAEISEGLGISRQAIHDAVKSAEEALERYEAALHLLERPPVAAEPGAEAAAAGSDSPDAADVEGEDARERLAPVAPRASAAPSIGSDVAAELRDVAYGLERAGFAHSPQALARRLIELAERLD